MKFDKITGLWKEVESEIKKVVSDESPPDDEPEIYISKGDDAILEKVKNTGPKIEGKCVLSIRLNNHAEYLKWQKYNPGRRWEFLVNYPAFMRAEYPFSCAIEVEMMAKKIVQLLTIGFDVYSASWQLNREKEDDDEQSNSM